jgi:predicted enzyme related to lactoylglutathione lyase
VLILIIPKIIQFLHIGGTDMSKHLVVHFELSAIDREASGKFYSELFGWKVTQIPEMNYAMVDTGGELGGGLNPVSNNNPAGSTSIYIHSDDIDATLAKAEKLGGKTLVPKSEIPGMGWFALFADPTGNAVGLYTANPQQPA